jgi:hypothetical protein
MNAINYLKFNEINPDDLSSVLNQDNVRDHLVPHRHFDSCSIRDWIKGKIDHDSFPGCRIRAVFIDDNLAGWCGIQKDNENFELAIVISQAHWGKGPLIFKDLISWAKELEHQEVLIHLLETRREYRFLKRMSTSTHKTKMFGKTFITYHIAV